MTGPTSKPYARLRLCIAFGVAALAFVNTSRPADAQGLVKGVQQGAREGNKAAGPVGGVLGGAIGGVVGVVTGVTGVLTGNNNGQRAAAPSDKQGSGARTAKAAKAAKAYLSYTSFSRSGLIQQLEFEGYTAEQATYGVNQTGL